MAYLALYRRFRPISFDKVIGQDVIVKTLTNQIMTDKIGHAYLFCGARGTGKTSLAKIFAKAVNCLKPKNGSPCLECEACKSLNDSSSIDILEMDAASNNKVEHVREIRENVQYPPVNVKYKVYIIDEVHMLTPEAFNALLKTLEEPPKHAIFILATTEPQKLPATILSRCLRFDFRLIETKKLYDLVCEIYNDIGKKYTSEAVMAIAKAGEGSVRDTLSVADLCVSIGDGELKYDDVLSVLGATDFEKTNQIVNAIFKGDVGGVLTSTNQLISLGKSIGVLVKDLASYIRDLLVVKTCNTAKEILSLPDDKFETMKSLAGSVNDSRILRCLEIISGVENAIRFSTQQRNVLESALLKASMPENDSNIDALLSRIKTLEEKLKNIEEKGVEIKKSSEIQVESVKEELKPNKENIGKVENPIVETIKVEEKKALNETVEVKQTKVESKSNISTSSAPSVDAKRVWGTVVRKLRGMEGKTILWVACQEMSATLSGNTLYINAGGESEKNLLLKDGNLQTIKELASSFGDYEVAIAGEEVKSVNLKDKVSEFFGDTLEIK